jgi:hypothetical protein
MHKLDLDLKIRPDLPRLKVSQHSSVELEICTHITIWRPWAKGRKEVTFLVQSTT